MNIAFGITTRFFLVVILIAFVLQLLLVEL